MGTAPCRGSSGAAAARPRRSGPDPSRRASPGAPGQVGRRNVRSHSGEGRLAQGTGFRGPEVPDLGDQERLDPGEPVTEAAQEAHGVGADMDRRVRIATGDAGEHLDERRREPVGHAAAHGAEQLPRRTGDGQRRDAAAGPCADPPHDHDVRERPVRQLHPVATADPALVAAAVALGHDALETLLAGRGQQGVAVVEHGGRQPRPRR